MRNGKIRKVWIERAIDEDPDTSHLGTYANQPTSPVAIDREANGDICRGQYRYFNPAMTGEETGNPDSPEQDYQRMESLNRGEWSYVGIIAKAEIQTDRNSPIQVIRSGGLWGVESDSDRTYFDQVRQDELSQLFAELSRIGFSDAQIHKAYENIDED